MAECRITRIARADLLAIGRYARRQWGARQRAVYLGDLFAAFERLAATPDLGRPCDEIRPDMRLYRCGRHVVFFRLHDDRVEVLRVLHE